MVLIPTDHTLEGFLIGPIGAIHKMAAGALLGRVRSADGVGGHTLFGRGPGQLLWDMPQLGSIQIRVHGTSMEAHGGHIEILINESGIRMILDQLLDRPVDLLLDMTAQAL